MSHDQKNGSLLYGLAAIFFLILPLPMYVYYAYFLDLSDNEVWSYSSGTLFLSLVAFNFLISASEKLDAPTAAQAMEQDPRPPILYLRSFNSDRRDEYRRWRHFILRSRSKAPPSHEQRLVEIFGLLGPVIAIGRPGAKFPQLGAARHFVPDEQWQEQVRLYIELSQLVALRADATSGLKWELNEMATRGNPLNFIICLDNKVNFLEFRDWANAVLPHPLPETWEGDAIVFSEDWLPERLTRNWWKRRGVNVDENGTYSMIEQFEQSPSV